MAQGAGHRAQRSPFEGGQEDVIRQKTICPVQSVFVYLGMANKDTEDITEILKGRYFWDIDVSSGKTVSKRLIIERIVNFGTLAEMDFLIRYFGKEEVEKTLCNLNYIDPKTLNFVSKYFGKPKKKFRCYTRRRSMLQHWDY